MLAKTASIVHEDSFQAGREVVAELLDELGGPPEVVLVFASSELDQRAVLDGMWTRLPKDVRLLGCSSTAEIGAEEALAGSVTAMGFTFGRVQWEVYQLRSIEGDGNTAGHKLGDMIAPFDPKLVILLGDGLVGNSMKLVDGMQAKLGRDCPIVGGLASENLTFQHTYQLFDREVFEHGAVALALRGPISLATATGSGFQPVGAIRTCTEVVDGKRIMSLDDAPAIEIYKSFLGEDVTRRPGIGIEFPLAIIGTPGGDYMTSDERTQVIRVVRHIDEQTGSLQCGGDVYPGAKVRLTRATKDDLIAAARTCVVQAKAEVPNPAVCFLFACAGRKIVLGGRYQEEITAAFSALGDTPRIGFYCYGELNPVGGTNMYHDETFTLALVGEAP